MASLTRVIFSASSSGISIPNSSSNAMTSSTVSSESAPRSSTNDASAVTSSSSTPSCSTMMLFTLSETAIQSSDSVAIELHVHAAVDGEHLTCNIRCLIRREKAHGGCNVLRRPQALQRNQRGPFGLRLFRYCLRHVCVHQPRCHDVDRDVSRRDLARQR